jgi:hypothetical protein
MIFLNVIGIILRPTNVIGQYKNPKINDFKKATAKYEK